MVFAALVIAGHPGRDRRKDFDEVPRLFKWVKPRVDYYQRRLYSSLASEGQASSRRGRDLPGMSCALSAGWPAPLVCPGRSLWVVAQEISLEARHPGSDRLAKLVKH